MTHAILTDPGLSGFQYGMLVDLQDEIARITGGTLVPTPPSRVPRLSRRFGHGTRYAPLRTLLPKSTFPVRADVLWVPLMGPENCILDVLKEWDRHVGYKVLYLFDTMERQISSIRKLLAMTRWDIAITSFSGARIFLEDRTQRPWHAVPQGVKLDRFVTRPPSDRMIGFCSYGRRLPRIHEILKAFCLKSGHYYDYSMTTEIQHGVDPRDHYKQYAWHLSHSAFNICWPVEVTAPDRAGDFSPITCRWFEAAACGNVIIGEAPRDQGFAEMFGPDAVMRLDYRAPKKQIEDVLREAWEARDTLLGRAAERSSQYSASWSWASRVHEMVRLLSKAL